MPTLLDTIARRAGGIYAPAFRVARMMREGTASPGSYEHLSWVALEKRINGLVNKANASNIKSIVPELLAENCARGRGLFCQSCVRSQVASPGLTDVFAALVAAVNARFPEIGCLLLVRVVIQFKGALERNDKIELLAATKIIAHLVNQVVEKELVVLEVVTVIVENPTYDRIELQWNS